MKSILTTTFLLLTISAFDQTYTSSKVKTMTSISYYDYDTDLYFAHDGRQYSKISKRIQNHFK